jgi:putative DNA primase/helicase
MNLDTALRFARAGFHVVPVELVIEPGKGPRKKPHVKWKNTPTPSIEEITWWWRRWPKAMVGLILRKIGLLVLDGDRHPNKDGEIVNDGVQALRELFKGKQAKAPVVRSPSGGVHLYFCCPPGFGNCRGNLPPGVDVRGLTGLVIAPGTIHPISGKLYTENEPGLIAAYKAGTIPPLPDFIRELIKPQERKKGGSTPRQPLTVTPGLGGERYERRARGVLRKYVERLASMAPETGRNEFLNKAAWICGGLPRRGWLSESEVRRELYRAADHCSLVHDTSKEEVLATIESGISTALDFPDFKELP